MSGFPFCLGNHEHQCMYITKKSQRLGAKLLQTHVPLPTDILIWFCYQVPSSFPFPPAELERKGKCKGM